MGHAMVTRSSERHRGCGVIGARLRAVRVGYKGRRASSGLWGNCGMFDGGARWLQGQQIVIGVVGYYGVV